MSDFTQDKYPPTEFGGQPLKNMGGIQPTMEEMDVPIPAHLNNLTLEDRSAGERLQSLYRTGDEMGAEPDEEVFNGTQKGFPIKDFR